MAKNKVTSSKLAKLASKVMRGYEPTRDEVESLAACVLAQREKDLAAKKEVVVAPVEIAEIAPVAVVEAAAVDAVYPIVEVSVEAPYVSEQAITPVEEVMAQIAAEEPTVTGVAGDEPVTEVTGVAPKKVSGFWSNLFKK